MIVSTPGKGEWTQKRRRTKRVCLASEAGKMRPYFHSNNDCSRTPNLSSRLSSSLPARRVPIPQEVPNRPQSAKTPISSVVEGPTPSVTSSPDLARIMNRLHNLELLVAREEVQITSIHTSEEQKENYNPQPKRDFGHMLNRMEIIKSDFDVVAQVGGSEIPLLTSPDLFPNQPYPDLEAPEDRWMA